MTISDISEFMASLKDSMEGLFGNCKENDGVLRSMAEDIGATETAVVIEAVMEKGLNEEDTFFILHFHITLAQNIREESVPGILEGLNELNNAISVGSYPFFGHFGFFPPLSQIFLSCRMAVNPGNLDIEFENAVYYLSSLNDKLDVFADFILFLCEDPEKVSFDAYLDYLEKVMDTEHPEIRLKNLEKQLDELGEEIEKIENSTNNDI